MRAFLPAVPLLLLDACSASVPAPRHSPMLGAQPVPAPEQGCVLVDRPAVLPDAATLLENPPSRLPGTGSILLELAFDSAGNRTRADVVRSDWSEEMQSQVVAALAPRAPTEAGGGWGVLPQISGGDPPVSQVGRMEYCACALLNRSEIAGRLQRDASCFSDSGLEGKQYVVEVDIRSDFRREHPGEAGPSTRDAALEEAILEVVTHMQVAPPLLNRRPQSGRSRIPPTAVFPAAADPAAPAGRPLEVSY